MPLPLLDLSPYIHETRIHFFSAAVDKSTALDRLATLAAKDDKITDKEAFRCAIFEREEVSSTGIGKGVAVPHAKLDSNQGFSITIGICPGGIDYQASDEAPVHVLLMIAANDEERRAYLQLLATVANLLKQESIYQALCEANDSQSVLAALKS